jgi:hypothetical protein
MADVEYDMHPDTMLSRYLRGFTRSSCNQDGRLPRQKSLTETLLNGMTKR